MLMVNNVPEDTVVTSDSTGSASAPILYSCIVRYKEAYYQELEHFLSAVLDSTQTLAVQEKDTVLCSSLATACEESCKTHLVQKFSSVI